MGVATPLLMSRLLSFLRQINAIRRRSAGGCVAGYPVSLCQAVMIRGQIIIAGADDARLVIFQMQL